MLRNNKASKSLSFDLVPENKENEVMAALNRTEIELSKINKYLSQEEETSQASNPKVLNDRPQNLTNVQKTPAHVSDRKEHPFCSPRFNPSQEIPSRNLFKIIKNNDDSRRESTQNHRNNHPNTTNTFTLNDCAKSQSSETSKEVHNQPNQETPIQTFQMRGGTPEKLLNGSQRSSSQFGLSVKKNGFNDVSNNNFEDISEIQMIDNFEPDSFKLNDKSTLKSNNLNEFNPMNSEPNENMLNNLTNLTFMLEIEREKNAKLEEKLEKKDRLLSQMKIFHNELQFTLHETQKELEKHTNIRSNSVKNGQNLPNNEIQGQMVRKLTKENQELKKKLGQLEAQKREEAQKKEDFIQDKASLIHLNSQMTELAQMNKKLASEIEVFRQHKSFFEKEKNFLKASLQEKKMMIEDLKNEKEMLQRRIETLVELTKEKEKCLKIDQTYDEVSTDKALKGSKKNAEYFIESLTKMMVSIAPEGYFEGRPTLKKMWKLLKKIMEDYMTLKTEFQEKNEIIQKLMETFSTQNSKEILGYMSSLISEYDLMGKIIQILKKEVGIEENIEDLEAFYEYIREKFSTV